MHSLINSFVTYLRLFSSPNKIKCNIILKSFQDLCLFLSPFKSTAVTQWFSVSSGNNLQHSFINGHINY